MMQIMIGNARIMAHRDQLKASRHSSAPMQSNVLIPARVTEELPMGERRTEGDHGQLPVETNRSSKRKKRDSQAAGLPDEQLRRSKRIKIVKKDNDFVYE